MGQTLRLPFYSDCVAWVRDDVPTLSYLVDEGHEISRAWFLRNVELEPDHRWATEPWPWGTFYYRLRGWPIFWYQNSLIEHVYAYPATIARLASTLRRETE